MAVSHILNITSRKGEILLASSSKSLGNKADDTKKRIEQEYGDCENDVVPTTCPATKLSQRYDRIPNICKGEDISSIGNINLNTSQETLDLQRSKKPKQKSKKISPYHENHTKLRTHIIQGNGSNKKNIILSYWDLPSELKNNKK